MDVREQLAISFMAVSLAATVGLGGAVAYELGRGSPTDNSALAAAPRQGGAASDTASLPQAGATPGAAVQGSAASTGSAATSAGGPARPAGSGPTTVTSGSSSASHAASGGGAPAANAPTGVSNGVITVGGMYDETGVLDATVERDTVRAYFNQVNAAGGVNGYKFQLVDCDSAYDPTRGHQCSQQLLSQNILAMVGSLSASSEQPEVPYLTQHGMPVIGGLGVPSEFSSPLSYPVSIDLERGATGQGLHAADLKTASGQPVKHPGIVELNTNFTSQVLKFLTDALHSKGITEADVITVDATKADYTDTVLKLRSDGVDSIIAGLDPFSYGRLFQAMQRQNYNVQFYGSGLDKGSAMAQYGNQSFASAESITPLVEPVGHENVPAVSEYLNAIQKYYPNQVAALDVYSEGSWIAAKIFVEAVKRIGNQPVTRQSLVDSLNGIQNFQTGLSVPLSFSAGGSHDPNHCLQWIRRSSGTWNTYSDWNCF
jgi:branched-chain amino acid transport system substrate-binding protein